MTDQDNKNINEVVDDGLIYSADVECVNCKIFKYDLPVPLSHPQFYDVYALDHICPRCSSPECYIFEPLLTQRPYLNKNRSSKHKSEQDNSKEDSNKADKPSNQKAYWELDEHILKELDQTVYYISNQEPAKFYVVNEETKQIMNGYVGKETEYDEEGEPIGFHDKLRYSTPLLDAIPLSGIKYNNGLSTDKKYKLKFQTNTGEVFTTIPNTTEDMMLELRGRNLVAKKAVAEDALRGIVNSMELKKLIEVTNNIEEPGFYPDPDNENKITCYGLTFKDPTIEEIKECADLINEIVQKYERKDQTGKVISDRKVFAVTILKWSITAPFDWVMKTKYNKWLPWLHLGGWHQTGKNSLSKFGLGIWRLHNKSVFGFGAANTEYRLGQVLSQSTMPININEVNKLADFKYSNLVEIIKNTVDEKNVRGKQQKKTYILIPSLSAAILTGNGMPPKDGGYRTKCRPIVFTYIDEFDRESKEAKDFRDWLNDKIHLLGTLGDFTANYIMNNPELLKNKEWDGIGKEVLEAFYDKAGLDAPTWIDLMVEYNESVQTEDEAIQMLRGYFINLINDTCNKYRPPKVTSEYDSKDSLHIEYMSLIQRLVECCKRYLIPFISYEQNKNIFYITPAIVQDLQKNRLGDLVGSHKGLADLLRFKYGNARMNGGQSKVIVVSRKEMESLLDPKIEVDEKIESDGEDTTPPQIDQKT